MSQARLPPITVGGDDEVKGESVEPHPLEPRPPVGVVNGHVEEEELSDWDDDEEEEEARPHPLPQSLDSAHIPAVIGASREPSAVQSVRVGGGEKVRGEGVGGGEEVRGDQLEENDSTELPEVTVERSKVNESILSSESESDIPMFGGYTPTISSPSNQLPIRQGLTPPLTTPPIQRSTPNLTPTSLTALTPLSLTAGTYH